jgi:hypothetical protein
MPHDTDKWSQWDFSSLDDWEVEHCWSYEFTRLVPGLVRLVTAWREQVPRRKGQNRFDSYRVHQVGRVTPFIQIGDNSFLIPLGAYYLFPEWPCMPYLKIPSKVRFQRLKKLSEDWPEPSEPDTPGGSTGRSKYKKRRKHAEKRKITSELREIDPHPGRYQLDPVGLMETLEQASHMRWEDDAWKSFIQSLRKNILHSNKMRVFRSDSEELAILRIPWTLSDKRLLVLFSKWLAWNRPTAFRKHGTLGRSHPLPKRKTELEHLHKYLIVQDVGDWNVCVGQTSLFRDRAKWNECRRVVERIIADLSSYPGYTS